MQDRVKRPLYVSTAGLKAEKQLPNALQLLADAGCGGVELSGGLLPYQGDLLKLLKCWSKDAGFAYILHNYFPVPEQPFILNLGAIDDAEWTKSVAFCERSLELASDLGACLYGVHAGYAGNMRDRGDGYFFPESNEPDLDWSPLVEKSYQRLLQAISVLAPRADSLGVRLCVENMFPMTGLPPQLLTSLTSWKNFLRDSFGSGVGLLIDLAHLNIAAHLDGEHFGAALAWVRGEGRNSIYQVHLSENDGSWDSHKPFATNSWGMRTLYEIAAGDSWPEVPHTYESRDLSLVHLIDMSPTIQAQLSRSLL